MDEIIHGIIEAGTRAPSGDNCQPWRFEVEGQRIKLYLLPDRDNSLYSFGQHPSYIALGAAIENMAAAAGHFSRALDVKLFPEAGNKMLVAYLDLVPGPLDDSFHKEVFERTTNRKMYSDQVLTEPQRQAVVGAAQAVGYGQVKLIEDAAGREGVAHAASMNERALFENRAMHDFFYNHITWTEAESEQKKIGFYVKTLEIPEAKLGGFKLFRVWFLCKILNGLAGFSKVLAKENAKVYGSGAAIGAIIMEGSTEKDYVRAGMVFQRVWLQVTAAGLYLQPLTGILFLAHRIAAGDNGGLSADLVKIIQESYHSAQRAFGEEHKDIAMMFRIGSAEEPSARSPRFSVEEVLKG